MLAACLLLLRSTESDSLTNSISIEGAVSQRAGSPVFNAYPLVQRQCKWSVTLRNGFLQLL